MGSPLGPTLANFFLGHLESTILFQSHAADGLNGYPRFYIRYVDDIFCVFNVDFNNFLDRLNNLHPNLRFTYELWDNGRLAFLDTEISIHNGNFKSWVYRKKTNTNVVLNAFALCPSVWKTGVFVGSLHRAWTICSTRELFLEEVDKLRQIFIKNGYVSSYINRLVKQFLLKKDSASGINNVSDNSDDDDDNVRRYILVIPFVGKPSLVFKKQLIKIFKEGLDIDLRCVFNSCKVKTYFSLKSRTPSFLAGNVVYRYTCQHDATQSYIGETTRYLIERAGEHLDLNANPPSAISSHISSCDACRDMLKSGNLNVNNFDVIKSCKSKVECEINEAFLVKKLSPSMNRQLFMGGAMHTLRVFG